jgi:CelD/BcsL family acetyltransferase involved in cellulose biosynthesis
MMTTSRSGTVRAQGAGDPVRKIVLITDTQGAVPQAFQAGQLIAQAWRQLAKQSSGQSHQLADRCSIWAPLQSAASLKKQQTRHQNDGNETMACHFHSRSF